MEMSVNEIKKNIQTRIAKGDDDLDMPDTVGVIPLIFAAQQNDADLTHELVAFRATVDVQDMQGSTPLLWAIRKGNVTLAHHLIDYGARGDIQDKSGNTPYSLACDYSLSDIVNRIKPEKTTPEKGKEIEESLEQPQTTGKQKEYKKKSQKAFTVLCLTNARKNSVETQKKLLTMFTEEKAQLKSSAKKSSTAQDDWYQLFTAVSENNLEKVTRLLEDKNTDINAQTPSDWTALTRACDQLNVEMVEKLIEHNSIIVDLPLKRGTTPLMIVASKVAPASQDDKTGKNAFKIVKLLLEHGAHIDAQDNDGATALIKSLMSGNIKTAKLLIKLGADTTIKDKHGFNALFYAAGKGHLPIVEKLIKRGTPVDATTKQWNPVTQTISESHYEIAQLLQAEAAKLLDEVEESLKNQETEQTVSKKNNNQNNVSLWERFKKSITDSTKPVTKDFLFAKDQKNLKKWLKKTTSKLRYIHAHDMQNAIEIGNALLSRSYEQTNEWYWVTIGIYEKICNDHIEIIRILTQWLCAKNRGLPMTPLHIAIMKGSTRVAQWLIETSKDIESDSYYDGSTPLLLAIQKNESKIVQLLIEASVDLNKSNNDGITPLMTTIANKQPEIARLLIEAGVDVNKEQDNNLSLLMLAIAHKQTEIVQLLIKACADVNKSCNGMQPLTLAISNNEPEITQLLIQTGADIDKEDNNGLTPLLLAILKNQPEIARLLIEAGADVNKPDNDDCTPLISAIVNNQLEIAQLLIKARANVNVNLPDRTGIAHKSLSLLEYIAKQPKLLEIFSCILVHNADLSEATKLKMRVWAIEENNQKAIETLDAFNIDYDLGGFYKISKDDQQNKQTANNPRRTIVHAIEKSTGKPTDLIELIEVLDKYNMLNQEAMEDIEEAANQKASIAANQRAFLLSRVRDNLTRLNTMQEHIHQLQQSKQNPPSKGDK